MSSLKLLKILNPIMAIAFIVGAVAVILYKFPLITKLQGDEIIGKIHETAGIIFIMLAILHIILNWNWIKLHFFGIKVKNKKQAK